MATNYPDGLDSFVNPTGTDALSSPAHATQHANVNDAVEAIEATLGLNPEGTYTDVSDRLDALVTDAAAAASAYNDSAQAAMGSAISAAGSAQSYSVDSYSYSQFASTDADLASAAAGSAVASASAAAASASSAASSAATVDATATTATEFRQFAADGSVLANLPARVHPAEQLLKQAVWWIDAAHSSASGQTIKNLGWGGSALDAQCGSTGSADSNDPKYLAWEGENYVYLPGASGPTKNGLSVPDEAALRITSDIVLAVRVAADDWTPSELKVLIAKEGNTSGTRGWLFYLNTNGRLAFAWSTDGTNANQFTLTSSAAPTVNDGDALWVKVAFDADNGASGRTAKFYTSNDGTTWTQLGTDVTSATATSIYSNTSNVGIGAWDVNSPANVFSGRVYRAQVWSDLAETTKVLDVDCSQITSGSNTSFTALTGQTVTINRSTSGRKTVGVVHPRWLFGTDDYMEVPDNDLIEMSASTSVTLLAVVRQWATATSDGTYLAKGGGTGNRYYLASSSALAPTLNISDGTDSLARTGDTMTAGSLSTLAAVVDRSAVTAKVYLNGSAGSSSSISAIDDIGTNSYGLRIGVKSSGSSYQDFEFTAAAIWRRALTAGEIATLNSYFQGRG